jgi:hypothetical protein
MSISRRQVILRKGMTQAELAKQYIEQLSALPPRKRLEAYRAIPDKEVKRLVADGLPGKLHAEMLGEAGLESLNRNVREDVARREAARARQQQARSK